jgi:serine protease Do
MGSLGMRVSFCHFFFSLFLLFIGSGFDLVGGTPSGLGEMVRIQQRFQAVLEPCRRATVGIDGGGTGVIVSRDGLILTAAHVSVFSGRPVAVTLSDGRRVKATSLGLNRFADAGMVKITDSGDWPFVPLARHGQRLAGDWCFALGHPSGMDLERGAVLRVGRLIGSHALVMRTDCHLIGGDSGGPLFNLKGQVIGIHSRVSEEIDDNFHSPIEAFIRHWQFFLDSEEIEISRDPEGGFLGVRSELSFYGAAIREVVDGTPAAVSPLKAGDVISKVGGVPVFHSEELGWALRRHRPGTTIPIEIFRGSQSMVFQVKLGKAP